MSWSRRRPKTPRITLGMIRRRDAPRGVVRPSKRQLDTLCREVVFARDGNRCARCGSERQLQWCHVYSRRYLTLRWEMDNSFCGCAGCHAWWHHKPAEAVPWWFAKLGKERTARLLQLAGGASKAPDFGLVKIYLDQQLDRIRGTGGLGLVRQGL